MDISTPTIDHLGIKANLWVKRSMTEQQCHSESSSVGIKQSPKTTWRAVTEEEMNFLGQEEPVGVGGERALTEMLFSQGAMSHGSLQCDGVQNCVRAWLPQKQRETGDNEVEGT